MLQSRKLHQYKLFLKTLRRPESKLCSCPSHLHPRPWIPAPCLTTKPYKEDDSLCRSRSHSNPELLTHTGQPYKMDRSQLNWESDDTGQHTQNSLQHLYNDARILKEAFRKVRHGDHLSKDMCNTVKKWSKEEVVNPRNKRERISKREKHAHADPSKQTEVAADRKSAKHSREEENLRQELRHLRELTQSSAAMMEENKRLMRKINRLRQRLKREETTQKGSGDSAGPEKEIGSREQYVMLSLKKKYDDLLQYVLKVESENQKLKSLIGVSGEQEEIWNGSDREDAECAPRVMARLHNELEVLRGEILRKDEYILECETHLQTMKENAVLHESLRNQNSGARSIDTATLEEEWMRRLTETRDMYDRAIQGYKDQLGELQKKLLNSEKIYAMQIQELTTKLMEAQSTSVSANSNAMEISKPHEARDVRREARVNGDRERDNNNKEEVERQRSGERENAGETVFEETGKQRQEKSETDKQKEADEPKKFNDKEHEKDSNVARPNETSRLPSSPEKLDPSTSSAKLPKSDSETISGIVMVGLERYSESLENLVKRLESSSLSRDEIENTVSVIKETIGKCLNEWKESFQQEQTQEKESIDKLKKDYEDLQRKLKGKNKKIESLQNQCKDFEQQNRELHHQYSQLESRLGASQITEQLDVLQGLPKTLHETEKRLLDTRELFQQAQGEKQALQDQLRLLGEKLSKKESKLKEEREQSARREKEIKNLQDSISSLQHQLEDASREASHLQEQLTTKDTILEHTSAQLEERIRECASLSSLIDRYKIQQNQESDRIQAQLNERESSSHKQYLEAQALATRYQAQLSALRTEKDLNEKSHRNHIRKLEEQVDQLQLRNSTLQRQLTTITSTYHSMFSGVDLNLPNAPDPGSSSVKDM
nr:trichohyalin-like isoform X1 [Procambarus clarkii]